MSRPVLLSICIFYVAVSSVRAQELGVEEHVLDNGMRFLLIPRPGKPAIAAGWIAKVGSVNERPGITGLSHLFEHMMFKGTPVIGTKDYKKEKAVLDELDSVKEAVDAERRALVERQRRGEIADANDPAARSAKHRELLAEYDRLEALAKSYIEKDEFDRIYTRHGATGMNAGTSDDYTIYYIQVPKNKLELWFWMESERLLNPVFREFYSERDVVHEERRLRTDSTPTGKWDPLESTCRHASLSIL